MWHKRLGHLNLGSVKHLSNKSLINVSNWKRIENVCSSCQMSKSCRLPFSLNNELSMIPFAKVHCDLWGPAHIISCQGFKYYASFIDDHSCFTWMFPLKRKSEFYDCFVKFHRLINTQLERNLNFFQLDGGGT